MKVVLVENIPKQLPNLSDEDAAVLSSARMKGAFRVVRMSWVGGYEVTADNVIGAIGLPSGAEVHVTPKLPLPNIFRMLSYVAELHSPLDDFAGYQPDEGLFDIIGKIFAVELSRLLKNGLKQLYKQEEGELPTIRGRILFDDTLRRSSLSHGRIVCAYSKLSLDHLLNQAVATAANQLLRADVISGSTKTALRNSVDRFPIGAISTEFRLEDFKSIRLDRSTDYYRRILFLSKMVLSSLAYRNAAGENRFAGFLLDVSKLFEQFVAKALTDSSASNDLFAKSQSQRCLDVAGEVTCRPDLIFLRGRETAFVADTKYKDFSLLKFLNQDVYQLVTYLVSHKCRNGFLIYPAFDAKKSGILKSLTIPTEVGSLRVHAVCMSLESPQGVVAQMNAILSSLQQDGQSTAREIA